MSNIIIVLGLHSKHYEQTRVPRLATKVVAAAKASHSSLILASHTSWLFRAQLCRCICVLQSKPARDIFGVPRNESLITCRTASTELEAHIYTVFVAKELNIPHFRTFAARSAAAMFSIQSTRRGVWADSTAVVKMQHYTVDCAPAKSAIGVISSNWRLFIDMFLRWTVDSVRAYSN